MSSVKGGWSEGAREIFAGVLLATFGASCGAAGNASGTTAPSNISANVLSIAGSYPTQVSLIPDRNTCGAVGIQDNLTTVAHTPGAHTLSLTHAGNTYAGMVDDTGRFSTTPSAVSVGSTTLTIRISGQFSPTGFVATVEVDMRQMSPPTVCAYAVTWIGTKLGGPNVIPQT